MKGLKKYNHAERKRVLKGLIPQIKKRFGDNLIAVAACCSFARNEDFGYSDLELVAFVKKMPRGKKIDGIGKIKDGLLVEMVWMTEKYYLENTRDVTENWYMSGADVLLPLINKRFINRINRYKVKNLKEKCLKQASHIWYQYQEATAKVLNAIIKRDKTGLPLMLYDMLLRLLAVLSYLNQTPYVTFSTFIKQARKFKIKPRSFNELIDIVVNGKYTDLKNLRNVAEKVFAESETILDDMGLDFYYDELDFSKPMKDCFL